MKNKSIDMFVNMKKEIKAAGGLFCQYRPCRRDKYTIYDIENIRHGVVYARTPLEMNDPFDSMVGYSPDKIYDNCIDILINSIPMPDPMRPGLAIMLKSRYIGQFAVLLQTMSDIKKYVNQRRVFMKQGGVDINAFIFQNKDTLFSKCPKATKASLNKEAFLALSIISCSIPSSIITEELIDQTLGLSQSLEQIHKLAVEIRDSVFFPQYTDLLSKLTISCLSASGWDNQLMWAHYANSYSGICIEYDLTSIDGSEGFIYPVKYTDNRPLISLSDLGIERFDIERQNFFYAETDMEKVFPLFLAKNSCWSYEKEWRIINIGEPYTPKFVNVPQIASITFGTKVDPVCKRILLEVCKEKNIPCYSLIPSKEDYSLSREAIDLSSISYNIDDDAEFFAYVCDHILQATKKIEMMNEKLVEAPEEESIISFLNQMIDVFSDSYYFKITINRLYSEYEQEAILFNRHEDFSEAISGIETFLAIWTTVSRQIETGILATIYMNTNRILAERTVYLFC